MANGSDHLTAYNLYAEAVNQHGYLGEVYGLPRHLFEDGLAEWAERRGVLVKAIEDTALGTASVYRSLELPLPKQLPYASKEIRQRWADLIARFMPFDLVIDEHTADGQEARVSKTSVAGSWGAVAGTLRFFADRFGIARASIEGTTLSYDLVRSHARPGAPRVVLAGPRKHQRLAAERRLTYFGFDLETELEPLDDPIPEALRPAARDVLAEALRRPARRLILTSGAVAARPGASWTSCGAARAGRWPRISPRRCGHRIRAQLESVTGWEDFLRTRIALEPDELVDAATRARLDALPGDDAAPGRRRSARLRGRRTEQGVARVRLREGQARRLRAGRAAGARPPAALRGPARPAPPLLADTVADLQALLRRRSPAPDETDRRSAAGGARRPGGASRRAEAVAVPSRRPAPLTSIVRPPTARRHTEAVSTIRCSLPKVMISSTASMAAASSSASRIETLRLTLTYLRPCQTL